MSLTPERWPIDFDALSRGSVLPVERLEAIFGVRRDTDKYRQSVLRLGAQIEEFFLSTYGDDVRVRYCQSGLQVLTHPQQAEYERIRDRRARRDLFRSWRKAEAVDRALLSADERERHDRHLYVASFRRQQLLKRPPPLLEN